MFIIQHWLFMYIKVVRQIWSIGSEKLLFSCTSNHETPSLPKNVMLRWQLCYVNGDSLVSSVHSLSGYGHNASSASIVVKSTVRSFTKKKHTPDFFLPALFYPQTLNQLQSLIGSSRPSVIDITFLVSENKAATEADVFRINNVTA